MYQKIINVCVETSNHSGKRSSHNSEFNIFCWSLPLAFQEGLQEGLCRRHL